MGNNSINILEIVSTALEIVKLELERTRQNALEATKSTPATPTTTVRDNASPAKSKKDKQKAKAKGRGLRLPEVEYGRSYPWIAVLRLDLNLKQSSMAKAVGLSQSRYSKYERMQAKVPRDKREAIAHVLGQEVGDLFDASGWPIAYSEEETLEPVPQPAHQPATKVYEAVG